MISFQSVSGGYSEINGLDEFNALYFQYYIIPLFSEIFGEQKLSVEMRFSLK